MEISNYQQIFWDNDGVLVDTEQLYFQSNVDTLARWGYALTEQEYVDLFLATDRGTLALLEIMGQPQSRAKEYRDQRDARYSEILGAKGNLVIDGVREVLKQLHGRMGMGIVTSSYRNHFDLIHADSGLLDYMDFVLAEGDYPRCKPDPSPYLVALERSGVAPEHCLVIEDSERGLRSAKAAGLNCWIVPSRWTGAQDFSAADRILSGLSELTD